MAGTKFQYKPGILMGGRHLVHDCGESRAIGYFLEPLLVLGLFSKKPLSIRLKGIVAFFVGFAKLFGLSACAYSLFGCMLFCLWGF